MVIFLTAESPDVINEVIAILRDETFCDNKILDSAVIGVDSGTGFSVIHPPGFTGEFNVE